MISRVVGPISYSLLNNLTKMKATLRSRANIERIIGMNGSEYRYKTACLIYPNYPGVPDNGYGKVTLAVLSQSLDSPTDGSLT